MMRRLSVLAMALLTASCGGSSGNQGSATAASARQTTGPAASSSATASASASAVAGFLNPRDAALDGAIRQTGATFLEGSIDSCPAQKKCLTIQSQVDGNDATYFRAWLGSSGAGGVCFIYTLHNSAWRFLDMVCAGPESGVMWPDKGEFDYVQIAGGGCANVRDRPGLSGRVVACLPAGTRVTIDGGPTYIVEPQPSGQTVVSHVWWHLTGRGWMAHDFLVPPTP
jgi:hypothetical protein